MVILNTLVTLSVPVFRPISGSGLARPNTEVSTLPRTDLYYRTPHISKSPFLMLSNLDGGANLDKGA
jgi:hypothetical protein